MIGIKADLKLQLIDVMIVLSTLRCVGIPKQSLLFALTKLERLLKTHSLMLMSQVILRKFLKLEGLMFIFEELARLMSVINWVDILFLARLKPIDSLIRYK